MRILLLSDSYPPLIGGATRSVHFLALGLRSRGNDVFVGTPWQAGTLAEEDLEGIRVYRLDGIWSRLWRIFRKESIRYRYTPPPVPDPEVIWRLRRLIHRTKPDAVMSYGWLSYGAAAAMAGTRIPLILSVRDYANICAIRTLYRFEEPCSGPEWRKCLACASDSYGSNVKALVAVGAVLGQRPLLRRRVAALHTCSHYVQEMVHSHLIGTKGSARLTADEVIADFRTTPAQPPSIDPRLPDQPYILFVGALRRVKGLDVLVEAYNRLTNAPPLVLIGTPSSDPLPSLPESAVVLESLTAKEVMAAWARALFGVTPSVWPEPLGNVVHEGMSAGRPIIGTYPGGQGEMITDEVNGLLVPGGDVTALAEAMQRLIDDNDLRERLGQSAERDAQRFTEPEILPRYVGLINAAVTAAGAEAEGGPA